MTPASFFEEGLLYAQFQALGGLPLSFGVFYGYERGFPYSVKNSRLVQIVAHFVVRRPSPPSMGCLCIYIYICFHVVSIELHAMCSFYMTPIGHPIMSARHPFLCIYRVLRCNCSQPRGCTTNSRDHPLPLEPSQNGIILYPKYRVFLWLSKYRCNSNLRVISMAVH